MSKGGTSKHTILRGRVWLRDVRAARETGQAAAEYALILGLVALVAIAAFTAFGQGVGRLFTPVVNFFSP
jgi:Flp pilus assembly pilin Flp